VNVRGLARKAHKVDALLFTESLDVIAVQEVKGQPLTTPFFVYGIPIFKHYPVANMRGLAFIYDGRTLAEKTQRVETTCIHTQALLVEKGGELALLVNVYCPPRDVLAASQIASDLHHLTEVYGKTANIIVMGDFNENMRTGTTRSATILRAAMTMCGLQVAAPNNPGTTTWRRDSSASSQRSTLDFIFHTGNPGVVATSCAFVGLADHALLAATFDTKPDPKQRKWAERWNLRSLHEDPAPFQKALETATEEWCELANTIMLNAEEGRIDPEEAANTLWAALEECYNSAARSTFGKKKSVRRPRAGQVPRSLTSSLGVSGGALDSLIREAGISGFTDKSEQTEQLGGVLKDFAQRVWFGHVGSKDVSRIWQLYDFLKTRAGDSPAARSNLVFSDLVAYHKEKFADYAPSPVESRAWHEAVEEMVEEIGKDPENEEECCKRINNLWSACHNAAGERKEKGLAPFGSTKGQTDDEDGTANPAFIPALGPPPRS
jgi:endonuclease/exonuclease/phosphatase (EEP) superfamily protein YafD